MKKRKKYKLEISKEELDPNSQYLELVPYITKSTRERWNKMRENQTLSTNNNLIIEFEVRVRCKKYGGHSIRNL